MPPEIEDLFALMLSRIDKRYKPSSNFYIRLLGLHEKFANTGNSLFISVPYIASTQTRATSMSSEAFVKECEDLKIRVSCRSAGLIEVHRTSPSCPDPTWRPSWDEASYRYAAPVLQSFDEADLDGGSQWNQAALARQQVEVGVEYPSATVSWLIYENHQLEWIHRSAYDFVMTQAESSWCMSEAAESTDLEAFLTGTLRYIAFAPSYGIGHPRLGSDFSTPKRLQYVLDTVSRMYDPYPDLFSKFLDRVYDLIVHMPSEESAAEFRSVLPYITVPNTSTGATIFWAVCLRNAVPGLRGERTNLIDYVDARFDRWAGDLGGRCLLHPLESKALMHFLYSPGADDDFRTPDLPASYEHFALTILDRMLDRIGTTVLDRALDRIGIRQHVGRERRNFLRHCEHMTEGDRLGTKLQDKLYSVSCLLPTNANSTKLSSTDALAVFTLMAVYKSAMGREDEMPHGCKKVWSALQRVVEILQPTFNISYRITNIDNQHPGQQLDCLSWVYIEISCAFWQALIKHATDRTSVDDQLRHSPHLRFICCPRGETQGEPLFDTLLAYSECREDMEIEPNESVKRMLFKLLVSQARKVRRGGFGIKLDDSQEDQILAALHALAESVQENRQGLDATRQQLAAACNENEVLKLKKDREWDRAHGTEILEVEAKQNGTFVFRIEDSIVLSKCSL